MKSNRVPILISGSHRSGTTWVGRILGESFWLKYIHEPFNPSKHENSPISNWFEYISLCHSDQEYQEEVLNYLNSFHRFNWTRLKSGIKKANYSKQKLAVILGEMKGLFGRPLYKDPIAIFSAEWFYARMNSDIVICIRHPAAFVSSLKNLGWTFNFQELTKREGEISKYLNKFKIDIATLQTIEERENKVDIVGQGILLWLIIPVG